MAIDNSNIHFDEIGPEPSLIDLLNRFKKQIFKDLNAHHVGIIQSFDPAKQTCQVSLAYKQTYFKNEKGANIPYDVDYPLLLDVPVIVMGGGTSSLTFPIQKGDECLVCFNDRDIDNWFVSGQVTSNASARTHAFSDGIAIVGLRNTSRVLTNYDTTRAVLQNGTTMVGVSSSKVIVANNSTTLMTAIASLIDTIKNIQTTNAVLGSPCFISPTSQTQLDSAKTTLQGLLE